MEYSAWGKSGQKFFGLFTKPGNKHGKCYLACFELPFYDQIQCVFELLELTQTNNPSGWNPECCLVVISSRRILAGGEPHGFVIYDLPEIPVPRAEFSIPVQPIWKYEGDRMTDDYDNTFAASPVFYEYGGSSTPLVYVLASRRDFHFFKFSHRSIVEEHRAYDLGSDAFECRLKIGFLRGIMINEGPTRMEDDDEIQEVVGDVFPLPPTHEVGESSCHSWLIPFGTHDDIYTRDVSIDDRSGRVAMLLDDHTTGVRNILLIDPVPMPWDEDSDTQDSPSSFQIFDSNVP